MNKLGPGFLSGSGHVLGPVVLNPMKIFARTVHQAD